MRILVTGSRTWTDRKTVYRAPAMAAGGTPNSEIALVHGGAIGADTIAEKFAEAFDWGIEVYRPQYVVYGREAPLVRNREMVDSKPDVVLAFIKDESRGSTYTANYAESKGLPVKRYEA